MKKYLDNDSITNYKFNPRGLNAIVFIGVIGSLISIGFLVINGDVSPGFKMFMNIIWYPLVGVGYCISAFGIGFSFYSNKKQRFKQYVYNNKRFFFYFYTCAVIVIIIFLITLGILQKNNDNLIQLGILANKIDPKHGWTDNPNNWYGFIFLYILIPTQNYNILGTAFIVSLFWFSLFGYLINNFLNKYGFAINTTIIVILLAFVFFNHISFEIANSNPELANKNTWLRNVFLYSQFPNTIILFYIGMYIRRYVRIWKFKPSVIWLSILTIAGIVGQILMDYLYYKQFSLYNFNLANGVASPLIVVLSWLWLNAFLSYNLDDKQTNNKFIHCCNKLNDHLIMAYSFWFILVGWSARFIYGYLFVHIFANVPVNVAWYPRSMLTFKTTAQQNDYIFSFLIIFVVIVVPLVYYWPAKYLSILLDKIDRWRINKKQAKVNV
ncbi:hypothetical protein [Mycoplasma sp. E35C]|uniref:hypothetical protein n=1 Tax=Mycoplasma sp. E35C TaxID=2801918 RepID=UPI001CA3E380|nr:hypothetical protein [Mycoplasma sp. E35C]QZX48968.1 hypothetical protein JJE79_02840 [Mycoplasma sp. E35C]